MTLEEYESVKHFNYEQYVGYLHKKYGVPSGRYHIQSERLKMTRKKKALYIHHVKEDQYAGLSGVKTRKQFPEFQANENLVYCDMSEHALLHILIMENPKLTMHGCINGEGIRNNLSLMEQVFNGKSNQKEQKQNRIKTDGGFTVYQKLKDRYEGKTEYNNFYTEFDLGKYSLCLTMNINL